MKDLLKDIIAHTQNLGFIDTVKVTGTTEATSVAAIADNRSVIINGKLKTPQPEFIGTFGMPNLGKLKTILGFDDYDDKAIINVTRQERDGESIPAAIHFETSAGDFVNDYRLMSDAIANEKVKNVTFKGATWNIEFEPSVAAILRLKKQAAANSEEENFTVKTEGDALKIYFGDASSHSGNFVFEAGVTGNLTRQWQWPVKAVLSILDLPGDKVFRISDQGAAEITVDSGIAEYSFLLPAQSK